MRNIEPLIRTIKFTPVKFNYLVRRIIDLIKELSKSEYQKLLVKQDLYIQLTDYNEIDFLFKSDILKNAVFIKENGILMAPESRSIEQLEQIYGKEEVIPLLETNVLSNSSPSLISNTLIELPNLKSNSDILKSSKNEDNKLRDPIQFSNSSGLISSDSEYRGYEISRLDGTIEYDEIICSLCLNIIKNGVRCADCGQSFCDYCITQYFSLHNQCPNGKYVKQPLDKLYEKILGKLSLHCKNAKFGCPEIIEYHKVSLHEEKCEYEGMPCPFEGCEKMFAKKDLPEHLAICAFYLITCKDCLEKFVRKNTEAHEKKCQEKIIKCDNVGCNVNIKRKCLQKHKENECLYTVVMCQLCKINIRRGLIHDHELSCEARKVKCESCGNFIVFKDLTKHASLCEESTTDCKRCGIMVKRKDENSHNCLINIVKIVKELEAKLNEKSEIIKEQAIKISYLEDVIKNKLSK